MFWYAFRSPAQDWSSDKLSVFVIIWSCIHIVYAILFLISLNWVLDSVSLVPSDSSGTVLTVQALTAFAFMEAFLLSRWMSRVAAWASVGFHGILLVIASLVLTLCLTGIWRSVFHGTATDIAQALLAVGALLVAGYLFNRSFAVAKACVLLGRRASANEVVIIS